MRQPSSAIFELARQVLRREAAGSREPAALAAAVDRACEKLEAELENLVGPGGASALVRRARVLARRQTSSLDEARDGSRPGAERVEAENAAILAQLLGLLVNLMGEELGLRPVHKIWPDMASGEATPSSTETEG